MRVLGNCGNGDCGKIFDILRPFVFEILSANYSIFIGLPDSAPFSQESRRGYFKPHPNIFPNELKNSSLASFCVIAIASMLRFAPLFVTHPIV